MPTPAEIIAARLNRADTTQDGYEQEQEQEEEEELVTSTETTSSTNAKPSITDETAFPTLGGKKSASPVISNTGSASTWGPSMKTPVRSSTASPVPTPVQHATPKTTNGIKSKVSTIQEAFSLDVEDQLNVARPEFIKILTFVKQETKTNIECTTSQHTKKRTFLITGRPDEVKLAKRLVIKKLTKPVKISFNIPAKLRSRVIGQGGKTLKPIIQANEVKIEIGDQIEGEDTGDDETQEEEKEEKEEEKEEEEEDIFSKTVQVTIDGDVEGSKRAKNAILAIVKEETKNLSAKVPVNETIKPFAIKELKSIVDKFPTLEFAIPDYKSNRHTIVIVGERELVLEAKPEVKAALEKLSNKVVIEEVPIPKIKQQFLPIEQVFNEHNVLIQLPKDGEGKVKFIGDKKKIPGAQASAKKTTSQYKVEILDMSKAHKGNLKHVKAVASVLTKTGVFDEIAKTNDVTIHVPSNKDLVTSATIPIEIVSKNDDEHIKIAKKAIVNQVNKITPDLTKNIEDIDEFLLNKVDETIKDISKQQSVEYVILGKIITLFNFQQSNEDAEDFDDVSDPDSAFKKVDEALNKLRELATNLTNVTLSITSKEQDQISGPRGTTLKSILASVEPNTVKIELHHPTSDELYIHGIKSSVATIKKEIENVLTDAKEFGNEYTTTIQVPSQVLSRLIGKNGANLNQIRNEFGTRIDVPLEKDESKDKSSTKTEVTIIGVKRNVEETKTKVATLAKKWADETLVRLRIESQYHRRMIGPRAVYINRLQDKYNVKIRFPSENSINFADAPNSKDEVTIKGPSKGVAKAEEELKELYAFEKENGFKQIIQIPLKAIARVIGKSGETINDIADGTGIEYTFNRESEESKGYSEVELTGSKSALKEAISKIQEIIDEVENFVSRSIKVEPIYHRDLIGPGGSIMKEIISKAGGDEVPRNRQYKLLNIPNEGSGSDEVTSQGDKKIVDKIIDAIEKIIEEKRASITQEIDLPKEKHRLIIGPNGTIRHSLQSEFGVTIEIPRPNDESTVIKIIGLPEKIENAKIKIEELTKDDWNESIDVPVIYHALVSERGAIFKKLKNDFNVEIVHGNFTRLANKLSTASIPTPPESAYPQKDGELFKFTIVDANDSATTATSEEIIPWRLKGSEEATAKAAKFINERLDLAKNSKSIGWFYASQPSVFSKVIGPQGSKVNQIRKKSNTFITVPRATTDKNAANFIYLVGDEDNLNIAKKEIENLL
ncbi:RNA-binding, G protein protein, putative [Candida dubliniensis CD36]|uniref:Vigilin-like protein, putative n=1 Tax=Candida dubliniensis (strain CD36 / ATCC MYA-646 / CBS 7987 / NCPF 3949 / NRRL Y-17841) TaxID=573826 RepID=B9W9I2_CANDC|nr:RNA-binding, G protein protein, putative [Candida dubliniensis CD36]CAX45465.1 RNA-binding, G protein protein, putative [Candida dubliniensis CD36]